MFYLIQIEFSTLGAAISNKQESEGGISKDRKIAQKGDYQTKLKVYARTKKNVIFVPYIE